MQKLKWTALAVLLLGACAQQAPETAGENASEETQTAENGDKAEGMVTPPADPYPSTYERYPGEPVLITGATVLTGTGERIDNGAVYLEDGKIAAVGAAGALTVPEGTATIDAGGKWVTPGVIDIHSHLGDYRLAVDMHSTVGRQ